MWNDLEYPRGCLHPHHYNVLIAYLHVKLPPVPVLPGKPFKLTVLPLPPRRKVPLRILGCLRSFIPMTRLTALGLQEIIFLSYTSMVVTH